MTAEMEEVLISRGLVDSLMQALKQFLHAKPSKYIDEMAYFIWDEFDVMLSESTMKRGLARIKWMKKKVDYASLMSLTVDAKTRRRTQS